MMRDSFLRFSFGTFLWLALTSLVNGITCNEWKSCESSTLSETGSTTIQCYGYQSCMNSSILVTGSADIECNGAYSCAQSIVQQDGSEDIRCYGFHSCSHSIVSGSSSGHIWGYGASSLVNSNVTLTNGNLFCYADRSCADSFIVGGERYYMYGHLSGQNSIFQSSDSGVTYYWFYGTMSGQNATILCGTGHTCRVYCLGNGCHGLNLTCIDGNGTCTITISCTVAEYDEYICPDGYKLSSFMGDIYLPDISNISQIHNDYQTGLQDCSKGTVQSVNTDFCNDYQAWSRITK